MGDGFQSDAGAINSVRLAADAATSGVDAAIVLREHTPRTISISDADATALKGLMEKRMKIDRTSVASAWRLSPSSWAGVATLPSGRHLILEPKVRIGTLFAMIEEAYESIRDPFREELFTYDTVEGLFEFMVRVFVNRTEAIIMRGLLRGYMTVTDDPPAVRGRLLVTETLRRRPVTRDRHWCAYGRLSVDVPENRILLWTATLLAAGRYRDTELVPRLRRIMATMRDVTLDVGAPLLIDELAFHRLNDHYRPALAIARLLLDHLVYSGHMGSANFLAFLVDMNTLFEKYLGAALRRAVTPYGIGVGEQQSCMLDRGHSVQMFPDITLIRQGVPLMVVDAKYKLKDDRADIYQMVAYCHGLGVHHAALVYPADERRRSRTLTILGPGDIRIHYLPIALHGAPADMRAECQQLARTLIEIIKG